MSVPASQEAVTRRWASHPRDPESVVPRAAAGADGRAVRQAPGKPAGAGAGRKREVVKSLERVNGEDQERDRSVRQPSS